MKTYFLRHRGKKNGTVFGGQYWGRVLQYFSKNGGKNGGTVFGGHGIREAGYWRVLQYIGLARHNMSKLKV